MKRGRLKKIVLVAVVIYIIWKFLSGLIGGVALRDGGGKYLADRFWIERLAKNEREMVHSLLLIEVQDQRVGGALYGSVYKRTIDVVDWSAGKNELTMDFLQDQVKVKFKTRIWECAGQAPPPFDLCLELSSGGKTFMLYSREDWGSGTAQAAEVARALEKVSVVAPQDDPPGEPRWLGSFE